MEAVQGLAQLVAPWFVALFEHFFFSQLRDEGGKQAADGVLGWVAGWFTSRKAPKPDVKRVRRGVDPTKVADLLPGLAAGMRDAGLSDAQTLSAMADLVAHALAAAEKASPAAKAKA